MTFMNCNCRCGCTATALIASAIIGVITAFLQITGIITNAPVFLWVVFGIAVAYLGVLAVVTALAGRQEGCGCLCTALNALLAGILGAILTALILLAVGIVATSVVTAVLVGLLVFFFALALTSTACLVRCQADCSR